MLVKHFRGFVRSLMLHYSGEQLSQSLMFSRRQIKINENFLGNGELFMQQALNLLRHYYFPYSRGLKPKKHTFMIKKLGECFFIEELTTFTTLTR